MLRTVNAAELRLLWGECLSSAGGFLPRTVPLTHAPAPFGLLDDLLAALPARFHGPGASIGAWLDDALGGAALADTWTEAIDTLDAPGLDKVYAALSVLGHCYRWDGVPAASERYALETLVLPQALERPWRRCAAHFDVPRVGTLYSMVLCNWTLPGQAGQPYENAQITTDGLTLAHPWLQGSAADELRYFILTAVETEARGATVLGTLIDIVQAVEHDALHEVLFLLDRLLSELDEMNGPFRNNIQKKRIRPDTFLTLIQPPTIWGLDEGDGVLEGASGPQVGSLQCVDGFFGVPRVAPISQAILHSRRYMPAPHRRFVGVFETIGGPVREYLDQTHDPEARRLHNECVEALLGWRRAHQKRGAMYLRGEKATDGPYTSTGGVVALVDDRVRVFETAMVARQDELAGVALPERELTPDDELANTLRSLTQEDRAVLLEGLTPLQVPTDGVIIESGKRPEGLYLLLKGAVRVVRTWQGNASVIARIGRGALFGELSFFDNEEASASVEAETACEVFLLPCEHVFDIVRGRPALAARFYQSLAALLAQRLRDTSRRVVDAERSRTASPPVAGTTAEVTRLASAQARRAGRDFCDAMDTIEVAGLAGEPLAAAVASAGRALVDATHSGAAELAVRAAWPRLADSPLARMLSRVDPGIEREAEIAHALAEASTGADALGAALDGWLRSLPTLVGFTSLADALEAQLARAIAARPGAQVLAVVPAFGARWVRALAATDAHLTLLHPSHVVATQTRSVAYEVGMSKRVRWVIEPVAQLRRHGVEHIWSKFDVIVADTLLFDVGNEQSPLVDWLAQLLEPTGVAFFGLAQSGGSDHRFLRALGRWPQHERDDTEVTALFSEVRALDARIIWTDTSKAWGLAEASAEGTPDA